MERSNIPGQNAEEQNRNLQRYFREVFSTEKGRAVFNVLLADLHYFEPCRDSEDMALNNYAKVLLTERMGLNDTVTVTDALLEAKNKEID